MGVREQTSQARAAVVPVAAAVVVAVLAGDQLSKAWAWRHVGRVTVDTGGGVVDTVTGGAANAMMSDPFLGAGMDIGVAAFLWWAARRVFSRPRSVPVRVGATAALAAGASNLLDRLGLHRLTAPGSARGVVDWISWGGREVSPMNVADLVILAAAVTLGAAALAGFVRRHPMPQRGRIALVAAAVVVTTASLVGAVHSADGSRGRPDGLPFRAVAQVRPVVVAGPPRIDRGAPPVAVEPAGLHDDLRQVVTQGDQVTAVWASESVTVTGHDVLGWRTDGVSELYLHAFVAGPGSVELYLPPSDTAASTEAPCQWRAVPPGPGGEPAGAVAAWECAHGEAGLTRTKPPVLFP